MATRRASSPASPVTITISPQSNSRVGGGSALHGNVSGVTPFRSIGLTSPVSRRSLGGKYSCSPKDETRELTSSQPIHYTVHIPPTPDRQPFPASSDSPSEPKRSFLSGTMFTGGFNSVTRGHVVEGLDDDCAAKNSASGMLCRMNGCDEEALLSKMPCECGFLICKDCYGECLQGAGQCPGCKEPYSGEEEEEVLESASEEDDRIPLNSVVEFRAGRRGSMVKSMAKNHQGVEFDHNRWLFETKGTYGYGNALWPKDGNGGGGGEGGGVGFKGFEEQPNFVGTSKRPLTRKVGVSQAILSPYRYI